MVYCYLNVQSKITCKTLIMKGYMLFYCVGALNVSDENPLNFPDS